MARSTASIALLLLATMCPAWGWKFLSNVKMPTVKDIAQHRQAAARFGDKKLVVVTGTSSGLGRKTARALLRTGQYHVVGAVRDLDKMEAVAEIEGFDTDNFTPMHVELNSFDSVRKFCDELGDFKAGRPIDRLICNAGIYQPSLDHPKWSKDNVEQQMQVNYLSHFLMVSLLLDDVARAPEPRVILVGSVTGNDHTVGGGGVYPIADLHDLDGLKAGAKKPVAMFDGYNFDGAKAYKDSKLCLMMLANALHDKYHRQTGIAFSAIYPGCIADSPLFREKRAWFRQFFPIFMKYITGGYVSEEEAGMRLFQVAHDPRCTKSGVYWSWNGGPREGRGDAALERDGQILGGGGAGGGWDSIYENDQSDKVLDKEKAENLFKYSSLVCDAEWPKPHQPKSPCPTLKVVGAMTAAATRKEELKRMRAKPTAGRGATLVGGATTAADAVVGNTVGRVFATLQSKLLGPLPEEALTGSFEGQDDPSADDASGRRRGRFGFLRRLRRRGGAEADVLGTAAASHSVPQHTVLEGGLPLSPALAAELTAEAGHHAPAHHRTHESSARFAEGITHEARDLDNLSQEDMQAMEQRLIEAVSDGPTERRNGQAVGSA
mmetsp:Transcript_14420/g.34907  ORF Transcript_14420/g.34907 Transcript_14420/m.34907 type:complete len:605 (+) Transcript_14420:116-1930(+)